MAEDPFTHLHVENYAERYRENRVGADDMLFTGNRSRISLNGNWRFVTDLFDEGLRQRWYRFPAVHPLDFDTPRDHDWHDDQQAAVPSCWNLQQPELKHFEGSCWYSREVTRPDCPPDSRLFLRIGAANYACRVFINGTCVAEHHGGSTPFFADLTHQLGQQTTLLHLQVENRREAGRVPMRHIDWFNYGGLYRDVDLIVLPAQPIRDFRLWLDARGCIQCSIRMLDGQTALPETARLRIPELAVDVEFPLREGQGHVELAMDFQPWSPAQPTLYEVSIEAGEDRITDRIGFRHIERRATQLYLNGEPLWLRGICCHEDDPVYGRCTSEEDIRRRFVHVRELGANAVRLTHYPHHELVARIADEEGILLIEEIPVYWAIDFDSADTLADARNQLRELIIRDFNRASVILWSIGNENADSDARLSFMRDLADTARREDVSRLVTAACLINRESFTIEDRLAPHLDVIGINEYFGWYEPDVCLLRQLLQNSSPDRPVIISETGADAVPDHPGRPGELFSEAHQADMLERQIDAAAETDFVNGIFPWLLYDYRTERRQTILQQGWSLKGLMDRHKHYRKASFHAVARRYKALATAKGN